MRIMRIMRIRSYQREREREREREICNLCYFLVWVRLIYDQGEQKYF